MSVIHTESWQRFGRGVFTGASTDPSWSIRTDTEYNFRTSYSSGTGKYNQPGYYGYNAATPMSNAWSDWVPANTGNIGIVADPVLPTKNRLATMMAAPITQLWSPNGSGGGEGGYMMFSIERPFAKPLAHYFGGVLVRFNSGALKNTSPTASFARANALIVTALNQTATTAGDPNWLNAIPGGASAMPKVPFSLSDQSFSATKTLSGLPSSCYNHGIRTYSGGVRDVTGNDFVFKYDTDLFLEFEVDVPNKILRFWIDDLLVATPAWSDVGGTLATLDKGFALWLSTLSNAAGDCGAMMVSDMYVVDATDNIAPTTRLGASTRVVGEAPDTDVCTDFSRPIDVAANHYLLDVPVTAQTPPEQFLSGDFAGAEDRYRKASAQTTPYAATVHAVNLRARYANTAISTHEMAGVLQNAAGDRSEISFGQIPAATGYKMSSTVQSLDPSGKPWTPETAAAVEFGFKIKS